MERSAPLKAKCKVTHSSPRNMRHGTPCRAMVGGGVTSVHWETEGARGKQRLQPVLGSLCKRQGRARETAEDGLVWITSGLRGDQVVPSQGTYWLGVWRAGRRWFRGWALRHRGAVAVRSALYCNWWMPERQTRSQENTVGTGVNNPLHWNSESRSWTKHMMDTAKAGWTLTHRSRLSRML